MNSDPQQLETQDVSEQILIAQNRAVDACHEISRQLHSGAMLDEFAPTSIMMRLEANQRAALLDALDRAQQEAGTDDETR